MNRKNLCIIVVEVSPTYTKESYEVTEKGGSGEIRKIKVADNGICSQLILSPT